MRLRTSFCVKFIGPQVENAIASPRHPGATRDIPLHGYSVLRCQQFGWRQLCVDEPPKTPVWMQPMHWNWKSIVVVWSQWILLVRLKQGNIGKTACNKCKKNRHNKWVSKDIKYSPTQKSKPAVAALCLPRTLAHCKLNSLSRKQLWWSISALHIFATDSSRGKNSNIIKCHRTIIWYACVCTCMYYICSSVLVG